MPRAASKERGKERGWALLTILLACAIFKASIGE